MDESKIREHLEEANQHVKKAEDLIEQQEEGVEEMARDGHQTKIHKQYLEALREVKETSEKSWDSIPDEIEGRRGRIAVCLLPSESLKLVSEVSQDSRRE